MHLWILNRFFRGAGYKTLLLAVYKTSLFFGGSEVAAYKTSLFFEVPKWLSIKPYFFRQAKFAKGLFLGTLKIRWRNHRYNTRRSELKSPGGQVLSPLKWLLIRPYGDFVSGLITSPPVVLFLLFFALTRTKNSQKWASFSPSNRHLASGRFD